VLNFSINEKEQKQITKWLRKHSKTCSYHDDLRTLSPKIGAIGGNIGYKFIPTGLGVITIVYCACGEELNVTDFSDW
jgi:hypothetical protein